VSGNDGQNHLTRTGTIFGTPFYMAPEQALGNPVDARTDIYAVGVIMYECFAGSLPFQGESFMGILTQHITMEPEPVAQRAAKAGRSLPPGLADVITRCMQKNPAQRFSTMDELVNVLVHIYRGIVGPGMSTYMDAFPVLPSAAHQIQPTPPPMTRPVVVSGSHAATIAAPGPSGSAPIVVGGPGTYPGPPVVKKSKAGLIIAIVAVMGVGGGIAALVVIKNQGVSPPPKLGSDASVLVPVDAPLITPVPHDANVPDSGPGPARDAAVAEPPDAGVETPDAGGNSPLPAEVVQVPLFARNGIAFEVFENGTKVLDGPDMLEVRKGEKRTVVIKAKGFKDKTVVVIGTKKRVLFSLERIPVNGGSGSAHIPLPPPGPNCSDNIVDPASRPCVAQYCARHPDDVSKCGLE
jgi:serine/threonine-protein kinase